MATKSILMQVELMGVYNNKTLPCRVHIHGPGYRLPRVGIRRLHIEGVEYLYKMKGWTVQFFLGTRKVVTDLSTASGKDWDLLERGQYKRTNDGYVTPAHIKRFLTRFLAEYP